MGEIVKRSEFKRSKPMARTSKIGVLGAAAVQRKAADIAKEPKPPAGPRKRKCAVCREQFEPRNMMHKACKPECAATLAESIRKAQERKSDRERRLAMKSRQEWLKEAQAAFNAYIRARDHAQPCISCGRFHTGSYDAGHYRSVGAQPALRFNETNVHKQCVPCNQHKGGNIVEYRIRLIEKIGRVSVEWLEQEHPPLKLDIPAIKEIKEEYKRRARQLAGGASIEPPPRRKANYWSKHYD